MNAFLLMIPLFLIRFGLLGLLNKEALSRAAFFAPQRGAEKPAGLIYQITNIFLLLYPLFLKTGTAQPQLTLGLVLYGMGIAVLVASTAAFAKPAETGINTKGIYRFSRNPMYIGYFLYFLGCAVLAHSTVMYIILLIFQVSAHFVILSEERWCLKEFGEEYQNYMEKVRRYL